MDECQYFKNLPNEGQIVHAKIKSIDDCFVMLNLTRFDREAMMSFNELSNLRKVTKNETREGKELFVSVLRVDYEKGFIDVSKKKVPEDQMIVSRREFSNEKKIIRIIKKISTESSDNFSTLMQNIVWPLKNAFEDLHSDFPNFSLIDKMKITQQSISLLKKEITELFEDKERVIRIGFDMTCFSPEGVSAFKNALKETKSDAQFSDIKVWVSSCPNYIAEMKTNNHQTGYIKLDLFVRIFADKLKKYGGNIENVKDLSEN